MIPVCISEFTVDQVFCVQLEPAPEVDRRVRVVESRPLGEIPADVGVDDADRAQRIVDRTLVGIERRQRFPLQRVEERVQSLAFVGGPVGPRRAVELRRVVESVEDHLEIRPNSASTMRQVTEYPVPPDIS